MARGKRTQNYRELRTDFDEEEERTDEEEGDEDEDEDEDEGDEEGEPGEAEGEDGEEGPDEEEAPKKKKKKVKEKPKPKRTRVAKVTRMRVVWGVFNNSHQKVAEYEYPKRDEADAHAARLTAEKKSTHFVQPVKEPIEEKKEK